MPFKGVVMFKSNLLTLLVLSIFLTVSIASCGEDPKPKEDKIEQQRKEEARKLAEEKKKKEEEEKKKAEEEAIAKLEEQRRLEEEKKKQEETVEVAETVTTSADSTKEAANTPTEAAAPSDDDSVKLGIKEYASHLFGYPTGANPTIQNGDWQNQLNLAYNHYNNLCTNNGAGCPIPNYQMFHNSGSQLGSMMFDEFYGANNDFLRCDGNFNDYFGGFVRGGWLNQIQIVINVLVYFNGRLINQEHFSEHEYAPVVIHQLLDAFRNKYEQYIRDGRCLQPQIILPPAPCQVGSGNCGYGGPMHGQHIQYPNCNQPVIVAPHCTNGCNPYGYGQDNVHWNIGVGGTNYGNNNSISWGVNVGGTVNNW